MNNIIFNLLLNKNKLPFFIIIFLMFLNLVFELLGLSLFYPLIKILIDKESFSNQFQEYFFYDFISNLDYKNFLFFILISIFLVFLIKNIFLIYSLYVQNKFFEKFQLNITNSLFGNYLNKELIFFNNENSSNILRNLRGETASVLVFFQSLIYILTEIIIIVGILIFLFVSNIETTTSLIIILTPVVFLYLFFTKKKLTTLGKDRILLDGLINKNFLESITAIKEIKIYGKEKTFSDYVDNNLKKFFKINILWTLLNNIPRYFLEIFIILALLIIIFLLETDIFYNDTDTIAVIGVLVVASARILPSISKILTNFQNLKFRLPSVHLLSDEIKKFNENSNFNVIEDDKINNNFFKNKNFEIYLKNISFKYTEDSNLVLNNVNLKLSSNKIYGIIGKTGSGKSTFIDLISGFYKPTSGNILIDGLDVFSDIKNWRKNFGYVSQNIFLFDDTIEKNISLEIETKNIDQEKLNETLLMSNINEFVKTLPDGLKTVVGQNGSKLSGGQIQRLGISRALYQNPKIIIFDESTNALDKDTEDKILKMIQELKKNKLIFIVTHNTNPLNICDETIKIDKNGDCKFLDRNE